MVRLETVIVVVALADDTLPSAVKVITLEAGLSVTPLGAVMVNGGVPPTGLGSAVSHAEHEYAVLPHTATEHVPADAEA